MWKVAEPPVPNGCAVVDFHTHTYFSGDSNTSISEYVTAFRDSKLTHVAVTDHRTTDAYLPLEELLGQKVIRGQEQRVREGEVIGLFLSERIPPGLDLREASSAIREQGGVVYACHPMDRKRSSLDRETLLHALEAGLIDAVEIYNSKSPSLEPEIERLARRFGVAVLGGSDAHVASAIGSSGAVMPWFDSPSGFLQGLADAVPFGCYCDPLKTWPADTVPPTSV